MKKSPAFARAFPMIGDEETRTPDILLAKQALYQLSYVPEAVAARADLGCEGGSPAQFSRGLVFLIHTFGVMMIENEVVGMGLRSLGGVAAALVLFTMGAGVARGDENACWQLLYRAVEHNAAAPHAPYISYAESVQIDSDGKRLERASANITYRDDGFAYIDDDRWVHPFISALMEPGPPVLGPYGSRRKTWLGFDTLQSALPVIADTHTAPRARCEDLGTETIDGVTYTHVVFPDAPTDKPALKAVWVDPSSFAVGRAVLSEYLNFYSNDEIVHELTDYRLDVQSINGYVVLKRVTWEYSHRVYSQMSTLSGDYEFTGYQFAATPPEGTLFATLHR